MTVSSLGREARFSQKRREVGHPFEISLHASLNASWAFRFGNVGIGWGENAIVTHVMGRICRPFLR